MNKPLCGLNRSDVITTKETTYTEHEISVSKYWV